LKSFVLDSSVALSWCFKNEETPETLRILSLAEIESPVVPSFWHIEMSNILGLALKKQRIDESALTRALSLIEALEIETDNIFHATDSGVLIALMKTYNLTGYDATYLELAIRRDIPLATFDSGLVAAMRLAGGDLVATLPS
jgi:predicted nucleic acid-binding protein